MSLGRMFVFCKDRRVLSWALRVAIDGDAAWECCRERLCRVEVRSVRLSVGRDVWQLAILSIARQLVAHTIQASQRARASQGCQLSLKIPLGRLETRQSLLVIVGAFIQALNEDILEEDVVLEIFTRGHGE